MDEEMNLKLWLESQGLNDIIEMLDDNFSTLEELTNIDETNLRFIVSQLGLNDQQIDRLVNALNEGNANNSENQPLVSEQKDADDVDESDQDQEPISYIKQMEEEYGTTQNGVYDDDEKFENNHNAPMIAPGESDDFHMNGTNGMHHIDDHEEEEEEEAKIDPFEVKEDEEVLPLIIPNNCKYDRENKRLIQDEDIEREKLIIYEPTLKYIQSIRQPVGTIVICGRARTGKSLIAGELLVPGKQPCPFELGNTMNACTYGIWVGVKPVYKDNKKTQLLIFDVEGTGFHESTKQHDMQLMIIALLISSYFIYNTKGTFDSSALDEIQFVMELTERIQATPTDETGEDLNRFLPKFMWLLRDVHLEPTIENKPVSIREYFTKTVLKYEKGVKSEVRARQAIREIFLQMFQTYDAFTLPMPHSDAKILQKLNNIPRSQLQPAFNQKLKEFCNIVKEQTDIKNLYKGRKEGFVSCSGSHLAEWITILMDIVNDPDKVPAVSSMTEIVMSSVLQSTKEKAVKQYKRMMMDKLNTLRQNNQDKTMALDEKDIIDAHIQTYNYVLGDEGEGRNLQPMQLHDEKLDIDDEEDMKMNEEANDGKISSQQREMLLAFYAIIGHHQNVAHIGKKGGFMFQILSENANYSKKECNDFVERYYTEHIEPLLDDPEDNDCEDVIGKLKLFEEAYYKSAKGPCKQQIWNEFKQRHITHVIEQFEKLKGFNEQLMEEEQKASEMRESERNMRDFYIKQQEEMKHQQKLMQDEIGRITRMRIEEQKKHKQQLDYLHKKYEDMQDSQFNDLAGEFQKRIDGMSKELQHIQSENKTNIMHMMKTMQTALDVIKQQPPPTVVMQKGKMDDDSDDDQNDPMGMKRAMRKHQCVVL